MADICFVHIFRKTWRVTVIPSLWCSLDRQTNKKFGHLQPQWTQTATLSSSAAVAAAAAAVTEAAVAAKNMN